MSGRAILAVLLTSAAAYALYGYSFGHHNHVIQLPLVRHLQDPALFPGDAFVATLDGYTSVLWRGVARAVDADALPTWFRVGHVLTLLATAAGVFALARATWPERATAPYVALLLWLGLDPHIGGEALHWFYFAHTPVATALALWCLTACVAGRARTAFVLAGLVFDVHALQGSYLLVALSAGLCTERAAWRTLLGGYASFAVAAAPGLVWIARSGGGAAPDDLALLMRAFYPEHFFPSSLGLGSWGALALCALICVVALRHGSARARLIGRMGAGLFAFGLVAGACAEWAPLGVVLKLHALRAATFVVLLTLALGAGFFARRVSGRGAAEALGLLLIALLVPRAFDVHAGLTALPWVVEACGAVLVLWLATRGDARLPRPASSALAWVGALALALVLVDVQRTHTRYSRGLDRERAAWVDVQRWAGARGNRDDLYLTPPGWSGFRCFSERPVVGEWKDGAATLWDARFGATWRTWYESVGGRFDDLASGPIDQRLRAAWRARTPDEIARYARAHGAASIVLARDEHGRTAAHPWPGARLYENARFFVVATPTE